MVFFILRWLFFLFLFCETALANICVINSPVGETFGRLGMGLDSPNLGYEMAFKEDNFTHYQSFLVNNGLELANIIRNNAPSSCSVVLGLYSSEDCLIAGPILKKNKILGLSPGCNHESIRKFYPYLYTMAPAISRYSAEIVKYLNTIGGKKEVVAIYQITDSYSNMKFKQFKKIFNSPIVEITVTSDGEFDINKLLLIKNNNITFVFFTYPLSSIKVIIELDKHSLITKKTRIMGSPCWVYDTIAFKPLKLILAKAHEVVVLDKIKWDITKKTKFESEFIDTFKRQPRISEMLAYDATQLTVQCYKAALVNGLYNNYLFDTCLKQVKHMGVLGKYYFSKGSSFATYPIHMDNFMDKI